MRLGAECKSSLSLRFRKASTGTKNCGKSSKVRQVSSLQQNQKSQKKLSQMFEHISAYASTNFPYSGLCNFDLMPEQLWQENDNTLLPVYNFDETRTTPLFPLPQSTFLDGNNMLYQMNAFASYGKELNNASQTLCYAPVVTDSSTFNSDFQQFSVTGPSHHQFRTGLADSNYCDWLHNSKVEPNTKTTFEKSISLENGSFDTTVSQGNAVPCTTEATKKTSVSSSCTSSSDIPKLIPSSLASELRIISTYLTGISCLIPLKGTSDSTLADSTCTITGMKFQPEGLHAFTASETSKHTFHNSSIGDLSTMLSFSKHSSQPFPMDSLFTVSRKFLETLQSASQYMKGSNRLTGICRDEVDIENFVLLADSTYADVLDVYRRLAHLLNSTLGNKDSLPKVNGPDQLRETFQSAATAFSWKEAAAQACLKFCRFPDVSVGSFAIASMPTLQLGLGLRLADEFLDRFSKAVAEIHTFLPLPQHQTQAFTATSLVHPSIIFPGNMVADERLGDFANWSTFNTASASPSGSTDLLSLQSSTYLNGFSCIDKIAVQELDLRQKLAGPTSMLVT